MIDQHQGNRRRLPSSSFTRFFTLLALGAAAPVLAQSAPAAQQASSATTAPATAPVSTGAPALIEAEQAARNAARQQLTEALARIAADAGDWDALSRAGRAALTMGDPRAALGFLARAEALAPRDPLIKAAMGAAMVQLEDPTQAMRYFEAAIAAGGLDRAYMGDRALAFDLMGDQRRAQADYAVALQANPSAELTRRQAISMGISGEADQAIQTLGPLLRAQDRAAWRSRAMILAMNGRADEARQIARATMPAELAQAIDPYFALMDRLSPMQLAAAAHFGRFPSYETVRNQPSRNATRLAALATPPAVPARVSERERERERDRRRTRGRRAEERQVAANSATPPVAAPSTNAANAVPISAAPAPLLRPAAAVPAVVTPAPAPARVTPPPPVAVAARNLETARITPPSAQTVPAAAPALATTPATAPATRPITAPAPTPAPALATALPAAAAPQPAAPQPAAPPSGTSIIAGWSMADVVAAMDVPAAEAEASAGGLSLADIQAIAAERRQAQAAAAAQARQQAQADARTRAAAQEEARKKAEEEAKARAEAERLRRNPARIWVQIATGANLSALAFDCRRFTRDYAASFRGQSCSTAQWNRTRRLVVGPFRNQNAARDWLAVYSRAGGNGFVWSSDAGEEVAPVGGR